MNLRLLVYLRAEHGDSVVKIARPCYQFIGSKLFSTTALKYDKKSIREDDLSTASDPDVQFVNVPTKNLSVSSVDHIRAAYTDENPQASRIALMVHGAPGNYKFLLRTCIQRG